MNGDPEHSAWRVPSTQRRLHVPIMIALQFSVTPANRGPAVSSCCPGTGASAERGVDCEQKGLENPKVLKCQQTGTHPCRKSQPQRLEALPGLALPWRQPHGPVPRGLQPPPRPPPLEPISDRVLCSRLEPPRPTLRRGLVPRASPQPMRWTSLPSQPTEGRGAPRRPEDSCRAQHRGRGPPRSRCRQPDARAPGPLSLLLQWAKADAPFTPRQSQTFLREPLIGVLIPGCREEPDVPWRQGLGLTHSPPPTKLQCRPPPPAKLCNHEVLASPPGGSVSSAGMQGKQELPHSVMEIK